MDSVDTTFVLDIGKAALDSRVTLVGYIVACRTFTDRLAVRLRDITGSILVLVSTSHQQGHELARLRKGMRIQVIGTIQENQQKQRVVANVSEVQVLASADMSLQELDIEVHGQASRMLLSRVCNGASQILRHEHFTDFDSEVISREWCDDGLEPLYVKYPGFGAPVTLVTSPAAQVLDFLVTTGARRAFTLSTSFTTTFRLAGGAAETRVIVAKAVDLAVEDHLRLLWTLCCRVLKELGLDVSIPDTMAPAYVTRLQWPEQLPPEDAISAPRLVQYSVSFPVQHQMLSTVIDTVMHVVDPSGSVVIEGAREFLGKNRVISTITMYPGRLLSFLRATPGRTLRNLGRFHAWGQ